MRVVIHDMNDGEINKIFNDKTNIHFISDDNTIKNCIGCYGCWIKTPGQCVLPDKYNDMGSILSKAEDLIIISKCYYGGYSPFVKNVLERSIPYMHPYFSIKSKEMHHKNRYDNRFNLEIYFYGENITDDEKETAKSLINANILNFDCILKNLKFLKNTDELCGDIK
jgi:multimeric flavodoxin WrbA